MAIQELMRTLPGDRDQSWIEQSLQDAIQLEFATIPPYLCAMWSITNGTDPVCRIIKSVVREEMLHMGLVCNMLAAIGGQPRINVKGFVPEYPSGLPGDVIPGLTIDLVGLSRDVVMKTFMKIEVPENGAVTIMSLIGDRGFATIGDFYDAILCAFHDLQPGLSASRQLEEEILGLTKIQNLADVESALERIKEQGEGTAQSPFADAFDGELAHYYRFEQIAMEKLIVRAPDGKARWGGPLVFPTGLLPMAPVPKGGHPPNVSRPFDEQFSAMLEGLQRAWDNGDAQSLTEAVDIMRKLKTLAQNLMKQPLPSGQGNYGPSFLLV